jgi:hypothetical protein
MHFQNRTADEKSESLRDIQAFPMLSVKPNNVAGCIILPCLSPKLACVPRTLGSSVREIFATEATTWNGICPGRSQYKLEHVDLGLSRDDMFGHLAVGVLNPLGCASDHFIVGLH